MELAPNSPPLTFSILIIDDSLEDRFVLQRLLHRSQSQVAFEVREAENGAHGLALCRERLPDCILLDYHLGDMDGLDLLAALNEGRNPYDDPICPVVILTGSGAVTETAVLALKNGAQDYLVKERLTSAGITLAIENAVEKVSLRQELRKAEARFRSSLENMLDCYSIYTAVRDPGNGTILDFRCEYVNEAACRENQVASDDLTGRLLDEDLLPTHQAYGRYEDYVQVVETGEPLEKIDYIYGDTVSDGGATYLEAAFSIRAWKMGDGFAVAWRNITAQKQAEELLKEGEERLIRDQKRIEAELVVIALKTAHIAEAVQRSLLLAPAPDAYPGVLVESFYQSAWDDALIGGDFFDVFAVSENVVALVVGDATGKGVEAATYTAEVKFALRAYLREHHGDLPISLRLLNNFIIDNERLDAAHTLGSYVALAVVLIDTQTGEATCCCAGAESPLILWAETREIIEASAYGPLLGASESAEYTATRHHLGMGDLIALTTDGITEARKAQSGEFFGIEGFGDALREETTDPNRSIADVESAIVSRALAWADGMQHDDICLLITKRR
ncbi:hypothetical protein CCAX7_44370 [Capsulimonas corticalis]|uniref:Uncharacterized protein n=1 Tax=Capsulimonas corticalis TaxID=2219043 RepID=A0A402CXA4_9BACT|nr:SpoIIE family protein phosphatase [Capsulimonas corticalis]BDI32386.1 hypothetical protein CCAX7_44370 [Capsulimonas corticalis]